MDIHNDALVVQLMRIINKVIFLEKKSSFRHGDLKLYPSEIHLMLVIDEGQATNATEMAKRLAVTKGAVSQTLSRLEKKGVLHKTKDPYNKNELTASFTPLGQEAVEGYRELQASFHKLYAQYFSTLSESEREIIGRFLSQLEVITASLIDS
jgi:DNA-binding MarR family transcriptional regulator